MTGSATHPIRITEGLIPYKVLSNVLLTGELHVLLVLRHRGVRAAGRCRERTRHGGRGVAEERERERISGTDWVGNPRREVLHAKCNVPDAGSVSFDPLKYDIHTKLLN